MNPHRLMSRTGLTALTVMLLVACARVGTPESSVGPSSDAPESSRPVRSLPAFATAPPSEAAVTGEVPAEILTPIIDDAALRSGTAATDIEVRQAESVTWPDGSLGCPEPGMMYTQALIDGYHVVLDADGEQLDYRVGNGGSFRLCEGFGAGR